ncbi:SCP-like extracellular [Flaviaesturariibacter flavus]|uniref:SCP-like extracellular n=1 Tax=Flaviaesturariibacter flavus TaxID=2502780 RepID=A0A4R1B7X7_9BACT|nr:CAP domain-containing protein [Flaviaesturariibacter flavus]TCJ13297.1 SCP-like extracellular [Flaviaesturariibacter flavus]
MKPLLLLSTLLITAAAGAQSPKTGSAVPVAEARAALEAHNRIRAEVGTPPLQWSPSLATYAQAWADHLAADGSCRMQHRPMGGQWAQQYGENLFWGNGRYFDAADATNAWYGERKDFRYGPVTESNYARIGHYTQLVWSNTTQVGMGAARCRNGAWIIVANYNPRGNFVGVKPY